MGEYGAGFGLSASISWAGNRSGEHRRRLALASGGLVATIVAEPTVGISQSCEALPVDESPLSYEFRTDDAPRCEGMCRSPVSGRGGMTLVSLTFGKVTYDTRRDQYLEIKLAVA